MFWEHVYCKRDEVHIWSRHSKHVVAVFLHIYGLLLVSFVALL